MTAPVDWDRIDLVVFDVDGTLYDAGRLRMAMLRLLLAHAWRTRSLRTLRILRAFRQAREALADEGGEDFARLQYERPARLTGSSPGEVRALVEEWMERRPLPLLAGCRRPGLQALFEGLHAAGRLVAVWSDYPAAAKLQALGLRADLVVCAGDAGIGRLKPDPRGLHAILLRAGVAADRALMIGDRPERDGRAAQRAGVRALLHAQAPVRGMAAFRRFDDAVFQPVLRRAAAARR